MAPGAQFTEPRPLRPKRSGTVRAAVGTASICLLVPAVPAAATPPAHLETCIACHGRDGRSISPEIPHLAGQQLNYLVKQLHAFRSGDRKSALMQPIAGQLTAEDIAALAQYWSHLPPGGGEGAARPDSATVASAMAFPAGFPAGLSEYDRETDEKTHHITVRYANRVALDAARAGRPMPPGALIASGDYAAILASDGTPELDAQGRWKLGPLQSVAGMESREGWGGQVPALLRNGDWHYGLWSADGQTRLRHLHAQCLACHQPKAAQSHVFTWDALRRPQDSSRPF